MKEKNCGQHVFTKTGYRGHETPNTMHWYIVHCQIQGSMTDMCPLPVRIVCMKKNVHKGMSPFVWMHQSSYQQGGGESVKRKLVKQISLCLSRSLVTPWARTNQINTTLTAFKRVVWKGSSRYYSLWGWEQPVFNQTNTDTVSRTIFRNSDTWGRAFMGIPECDNADLRWN